MEVPWSRLFRILFWCFSILVSADARRKVGDHEHYVALEVRCWAHHFQSNFPGLSISFSCTSAVFKLPFNICCHMQLASCKTGPVCVFATSCGHMDVHERL